jgi:thymidylate synthase (FAD)
MKVTLISHSKSNVPGIETLEDMVAYCARVSNPENQFNTETGTRLIKYLINNSHWSPLEMVHVTLEIETTRDIARQILRHRSFSFQEFSQRYADPTKHLNFETREARLQDTKNRQNSLYTDDQVLKDTWKCKQRDLANAAIDLYSWATENGIAKEQARAVLPEGLIQSRLYMAGSLRSWLHYIQLRTENGTQKEHREVATECAKVIGEIFPLMREYVPLFDSTPTYHPV